MQLLTAINAYGDTGLILDAIEAVANATKYPEFKGNVAAVYTHPLENTPGSSGGHYVCDISLPLPHHML